MKRLWLVATVILLASASADSTLAQSAVHRKNPYAPLEKTADLKSADPNAEAQHTSKSEVPLAMGVFRLNFAKAKDIEKTIGTLVSRDGKVGRDDRLNSIVVLDTTTNLERVKHVLEQLDVKTPQVMIDVLIINVQLTAEMKMGVDWTKLGTSNASFGQGLSATGSANPFGKVSFSTTSGNWSIAGLIDFVATHTNVKPIFDTMKLQFLVCAGVARLAEALGTTSDSMEPWVCGVHDGSSGTARTTGPRATPAA